MQTLSEYQAKEQHKTIFHAKDGIHNTRRYAEGIFIEGGNNIMETHTHTIHPFIYLKWCLWRALKWLIIINIYF